MNITGKNGDTLRDPASAGPATAAGASADDATAAPTSPGSAECGVRSDEIDETVLAQAIEVIRREGASITKLQRRLTLSYVSAARIMDELEARGVVGPAKGDEPRDVLSSTDLTGERVDATNLPETESAPSLTSAAAESDAGGQEQNAENFKKVEAACTGSQPPVADVAGVPQPPAGASADDATDLRSEISNFKGTEGTQENGKPLSRLARYLDGDEKSGDIIPPGAGGPGGPPREGGGDCEGSKSAQALRRFYAQLSLSDADRAMLWTKRGLTAETCAKLGFVSSPQSNKELLLALKNEFPMAVLVDAGLFTDSGREAGGEPKPNAQLYGYGLVSRAVRDKSGHKGEDEWGWTYPVLIPYFDSQGGLVALRPHKGGLAGKAVRLYIVRERGQHTGLKAPADGAIVTEGEFKAAALWQALGGKFAVAAVPGIWTGKTLIADIEDWGEELPGRRRVVIAFDNEDKGTPGLPGYKADKSKRYDADICGQWLARELTRQGFDGRVCVLPKTWRDKRGKADWDGALAAKIAEFRVRSAELNGLPLSSNMIWAGVAHKVRGEFLRALNDAVPHNDAWSFFDTEENHIIQNGVMNLSYEPNLPVGGDHEVTVSRRLIRLARRFKDSGRKELPGNLLGFLRMLALKYRDLDGKYYMFKRLTENKQEEWQGVAAQASESEDVDLKRACEVVLKGIPEAVSDFYLECRYELVRADGKRDRLVVLKNIHGRVTKLISLDSTAFAQPSKWREWLLNQGGFTWTAGEQALQALQLDLARATARLEVLQVSVRGWNAEAKIWFFGDAAVRSAGGELLEPDKNGIFWIDGQGYKLGERDQEGEEFAQGLPLMKPRKKCEWGGKSGDEAVERMFRDTSQKLFETFGAQGDYDGFMCLGMMLACGAAPEIYDAFTAFPGLWLHGESGHGKSSLAKWLLRVWGFSAVTGIRMPESSKPGVAAAMQQYGNLPLWLEELQSDTRKELLDMVQSAFNRESGRKITFGEKKRKIVGSCLVTGVATASDPQLRSRYAHVQASAVRRLADHFEWFEAHSLMFFHLGRFILQHREEYARLVMECLRRWEEAPDMKGVNPRARLVHGVAYAGFYAMVALCGQFGETISSEQMKGYRDFLVRHCMAQATEVTRRMDANVFFENMLAAKERDAFGVTPAERQRIFLVLRNKNPRVVIPEWELATAAESGSTYEWRHLLLYFQPQMVIDAVREYLRRMGTPMTIDQADLFNQMKTHDYWVPALTKDGGHRQRFRGMTGTKRCWCIDLDLHPLGRRILSLLEWQASLHVDGDLSGQRIPAVDWIDPRKGDVFALVDSLKSPDKEG